MCDRVSKKRWSDFASESLRFHASGDVLTLKASHSAVTTAYPQFLVGN